MYLDLSFKLEYCHASVHFHLYVRLEYAVIFLISFLTQIEVVEALRHEHELREAKRQ